MGRGEISLSCTVSKNNIQIEDGIRDLPQSSTLPYITFIQMCFYYQNFVTFFVFDFFLDSQKWDNSQQ